MTTFIITSDNNKKPNWNGLEFSKKPAQIYPQSLLFKGIEDCYKEMEKTGIFKNITVYALDNKQMAEKIMSKDAIF